MNRKTKRDLAVSILICAILLLMVVVAVFPAIWMISASIKDVTELFDIPPEIILDHPTFGNYLKVLGNSKTFRAFFSSAFITACVVLLTLLFSVLAGYGLARYQFKGHGLMKVALLLGQMVPGMVIIIPLYSVFTKLGLLDTHFSMIVTDMALTIPMGVIVLSSFFEGMPKELEEAAKIDGTIGFSVLLLVVMPTAKPGLVSMAIYTFINAWEEFLFAVNLSMSTKTRILPIAIGVFAGEFAVDWGATMAAVALVTLPVLVLFLLCNRYFVQELSDGAVKS